MSIFERIDRKSCAQASFENTEAGFGECLRWTAGQSKIKRANWWFCEHTGLYSRRLSDFLAKRGLFIWLENPLQIKACSGIRRAKIDCFDSLVIACYACRHIDKAVAYQSAGKEINALQLLASFRSRLVKCKVALEVAANEMRRVRQRDITAGFVYEHSMCEVKRIKKQIGEIEQKMHHLIMNSPLKENYLLINSIKGVGMQMAIMLLIHTANFSGFDNARQIASYCGCAPFPNESGNMNKGSHVSHLANKELKVLLSQCATSAIQYNKELAAYAKRKIEQGKSKRLVINNVRNKLIQRIFAVVTAKTPYCENYSTPRAFILFIVRSTCIGRQAFYRPQGIYH